ncbi:ATP-binding protein [Desulfococcaceae bacterium HSG8]|nr:ATP-binding protein [Desulfococcaceae bacterium HSG8]
MSKFFNTAGPCKQELHYMVDPLPRLPIVPNLVEGQHFFIIYGPPRSGKSTYLQALMHQINEEGNYSAIAVNIRAATAGKDPDSAMMLAANAIYKKTRRCLPEKECPDPVDQKKFIKGQLQGYLSQWAEKNPKQIVLLIDGADSLPDDFFSVIMNQLLAGFEDRPDGFPRSIGLTGLRDIRDHRPGQKIMVYSLNMKAEPLFVDVFKPSEVDGLLNQHIMETGQVFGQKIKNEIFRLTQGQPWLTNMIAREIVTGILKDDYSQTIMLAHVAEARESLIRQQDIHLDNLPEKLKEPAMKHATEAVISGEFLQAGRLDELRYLQNIGLVTRKPPIEFANPIYTEIIPRMLNHCWEISFTQEFADQKRYLKNGRLNPDALLSSFQRFYRRYSESWLEGFDFREASRQLLLMAFLQRIIGDNGAMECELSVGSGCCNILLEFSSEHFALEIKLKRDRYSEQDGLRHIATYLDKVNLNHGYLVLFETSSQMPWEKQAYQIESEIPWEKRIYRKEIQQDGKRIVLIGM